MLNIPQKGFSPTKCRAHAEESWCPSSNTGVCLSLGCKNSACSMTQVEGILRPVCHLPGNSTICTAVFFRFLEVPEGSSDASINGNVEKWYPLHTEPSIASRSMDQKTTSLKVFAGREWHQVPHKVHVCHCNSAMNALEDGFGHAHTLKCGIYCNLDIILMGETMITKRF